MTNNRESDQFKTEAARDTSMLEECLKDDANAINYLGWAERIEKIGKSLIIFFSVVGIVSILYILFGSQTPDEAKVFPIISIVVGTLLTVFVIHIVFRIVSLHFAMQAEILNNTKISTKLLTYIASQK